MRKIKSAHISLKTKGHLLNMIARMNIILESKIILDDDVEFLRRELREIRQVKGGEIVETDK